jgi:hypothetical protein
LITDLLFNTEQLYDFQRIKTKKMAKESKDKTSTAVLQYFIMQNRPFAVNDLLQSAQLKDFGKAAVQKTLDQFVVVFRSSFIFIAFLCCRISALLHLGWQNNGKDLWKTESLCHQPRSGFLT